MRQHGIIVERWIEVASEGVQADLEIKDQKEGIILVEPFPGDRVGSGDAQQQSGHSKERGEPEMHFTVSKQKDDEFRALRRAQEGSYICLSLPPYLCFPLSSSSYWWRNCQCNAMDCGQPAHVSPMHG